MILKFRISNERENNCKYFALKKFPRRFSEKVFHLKYRLKIRVWRETRKQNKNKIENKKRKVIIISNKG
jgi:hypothetical protein